VGVIKRGELSLTSILIDGKMTALNEIEEYSRKFRTSAKFRNLR